MVKYFYKLIISITDGQIFLESDLFYSGVRPAINAGLSVSRVGGAAQTKAIKKVSGTLRLDLASYRELEAFTQFGSDLDSQTKAKLDRGKKTVEVLKQGLHETLTVSEETSIIFALTKGYLDDVKLEDIKEFEKQLYKYLKSSETGKKITEHINKEGTLPENMDDFIKEFKKNR